MRKKVFVVFVCSIFCQLIGCESKKNESLTAKDTHSEEAEVSPALSAFVTRFEAELEASFKKHAVPGAAVAIVIDSTLTYVKALGKKSMLGDDSIDLETRFRLASVSKGFASVLAGKVMVGDQKWSDPVSDYILDFTVNPLALTDSLTVGHVLSHSTGYPYQTYSTLVEDGLDRTRLFEALKKIELSRGPGEIHSYQNVAYSLVEPIIESITDTSFQYTLDSLVFDPLDMTNASVTYEGITNSGNMAVPHGLKNKKYVPIKLSPAYYNVAAAGGINASVTDMAQWLKALLGQRKDVVSQEVLDDVFKPRIRTSVKNYHFSNYDRPRKGHYGYGWRIVEYPNDTLIYHGGYANGFKSELGIDRQKSVGICILSNAPSPFCNEMVVRFLKDYKAFLWQKEVNHPEAQ
ncbi:MAG: serine hydrolase domain-containing protein [Bacteroidota bacterium]